MTSTAFPSVAMFRRDAMGSKLGDRTYRGLEHFRRLSALIDVSAQLLLYEHYRSWR